jgi:hypothetical protein
MTTAPCNAGVGGRMLIALGFVLCTSLLARMVLADPGSPIILVWNITIGPRVTQTLNPTRSGEAVQSAVVAEDFAACGAVIGQTRLN